MSVFDKAIRIEELTKAKKEIEAEINVLKREVFAEAPAWLENPYHADTQVFMGEEGSVTLWWKHVPVIKPALVRSVAPQIVDDVTAEVHHKMIATIRT